MAVDLRVDGVGSSVRLVRVGVPNESVVPDHGLLLLGVSSLLLEHQWQEPFVLGLILKLLKPLIVLGLGSIDLLLEGGLLGLGESGVDLLRCESLELSQTRILKRLGL